MVAGTALLHAVAIGQGDGFCQVVGPVRQTGVEGVHHVTRERMQRRARRFVGVAAERG